MKPIRLALLILAAGLFTPALYGIQAEYHFTVCETSPAQAQKRLGATTIRSTRRFIYYFDTADRALFKAGVILRVRGEKGEPSEVSAKLRAQPSQIPDNFKKEEGFKCEADFQGPGAITHCSLSEDTLDPSDLNKVLKGQTSAESLFSKTQLKFLSSLGTHVAWRELSAVGPTDNLKWELQASPSPFDMELFTSPQGASLLQLSTKQGQASADTFLQLGKLLATKQIGVCPKQISTTAWALGMP